MVASIVLAVTTAALSISLGPSGDAFYTPPRALPSPSEGSVVWAQPFDSGSALPSAAKNYRMLYQTLSSNGVFVAISGTLAIPKGAPPPRGWPLISWAHATVGNAPQCAPSRRPTPNVEQQMLDELVRRGYAIAQTDYEGNGTPGIHPYMVAGTLARDVTDIVTASRELDPQIGRDWIVMGHSEGGSVALATAALGQQLAPNLNLVGGVAYAPVVNAEGTLAYEVHSDSPSGALAIVGLLIEGFATADPRVVPSQILEPNFLPLLGELQQHCIDDLMDHSVWSSTAPATVFRPEGEAAIEALYADLRQNDVVYFSISVPTFILNGVSDIMVSSERTMAVADHLRRNGTPVTFKAYLGATHASVLAASLNDVAPWIALRFADAGAR
ncbi:MAG: alpha/beta fold hydrolase [Candidatus Eremiobacteraeota bacterium]|nr:alpha/beta fold hydrolase [Candidatus Eremiobacteraeota bacterium]